VAKPYVPTYGLATIYAHTQSRNRKITKFAAFVHVSVALCVQNFVANRPRLTKL